MALQILLPRYPGVKSYGQKTKIPLNLATQPRDVPYLEYIKLKIFSAKIDFHYEDQCTLIKGHVLIILQHTFFWLTVHQQVQNLQRCSVVSTETLI